MIHQGELSRVAGAAGARIRAAERLYASGRTRALSRLERDGMPRGDAQAWLSAWEAAAENLPDFRAAPDFWSVGREYAQAEFERGYEPPRLADGAMRRSA
jgi:hypothetical protein